jgi:hypothetical protein
MKRLNNIFMSVLFVLGSAGIGTAPIRNAEMFGHQAR